jgi:hypothetical protein
MRRADLDPAAYARHWQDEPVSGPSLAALAPVAWAADAEGGTLLAMVQDEAAQTSWQAAFRLSGPPWAVVGGYVEAGDMPAPAEATSRVLAEVMAWQPEPDDGARPMTTLQAAMVRLNPDDTEPLLFLPESRFTCQGRQHCCHSGDWSIPATRNTARVLPAMPWSDLAGPALRLTDWQEHDGVAPGLRRTFPQKLQMTPGGTCTACFGGGCSVHAAAGWQPLAVCALFPFALTRTPDGMVVSLSYTCPTVAANLGRPIVDQQDDLQGRVRPFRHAAGLATVQGPVPLTANGATMAWSAYRRLEAVMLDWLLDDELGGLQDRLLYGNWCLSGLLTMAGTAGELTDAGIDAWLESTPPPPSAEWDQALANRLLAPLLAGPGGLASRPLAGGDLDAWFHGAGQCLDGIRDDALMTRYLRQVLFRKHGVMGGLAFQWGLLSWVLRVFERDVQWRSHTQDRPIDADLQFESLAAIDQVLLHGDLLATMLQEPDLVQQMESPAVWWALAVE